MGARFPFEHAPHLNYGFKYDEHPAIDGPNGTTMCLGFVRYVGEKGGGVVYYALGHCHSAREYNSIRGGQPFVHESANPMGASKGPPGHVETASCFPGVWESQPYLRLL